ncbi:MAG: nucleoside 2-deoxyribosyltransferase [Desulfatibacillaceae bacterium]
MAEASYRIYCSGPLFNDKEREEMQAIADACENAGFATFLPQRDGLELSPAAAYVVAAGVDFDRTTNEVMPRAMFALDVYDALVGCDAVIVNLNGRVPDEGAVVEAALAWGAGQVVAGYKADMRSVFMGMDNPMVTGLFGFKVHTGIGAAVRAVEKALVDTPPVKREIDDHPPRVREILDYGRRISEALSGPAGAEAAAAVLVADYRSG